MCDKTLKHFLWTMEGPHSSYSCFVIHICWKVDREAKMEPPIQTEYFLSGGAMILILMVEGATGHDGVGVQVLPDVNIALHDGVVGGLVDTAGLYAEEGRLEEGLGGTEPLVADGDDLAVGKLIGLLQGGGGGGGGHLLLEVEGDIAELLLDVTDNLTASQVKTEDGVGEGITFIDGDGVGDTIAGVHDDTGGTARGVQGEDSLDGDVHGGHVEGLKHDLGHLFPVGLGVEGSLSQEDGLLLGGNAELVVEGVVPDLLHVVPVGDDAVLNGVL